MFTVCSPIQLWHNGQSVICRVVKTSRLPAKITAHLVSISRLLYFAFLYGWCFLNKISLDWPLTLTTQPSTSKLSDNFFFFKEFNQCLNNGKVSATKRGNEILYNKLLQKQPEKTADIWRRYHWFILGDPGADSGARESVNGRKNKARRKVKNGEKSPWGQCLTRQVPNGRRHSGF